MREYLNILSEVLEHGTWKQNRTGIKTKFITGAMFKFDMSTGLFPLLTTKKMPPKIIFAELEGFIKGITDKKWYQERKCHIWDEWCNPKVVPYANDEATKKKMLEENDLGKIYGYQWNNFNGSGYNQLKKVIETLKTNPLDRRMIVMAWNPLQLDEMALPPCHYCFQLVSDGKNLDLIWSQRSVDTFLGLPFNIASYAMLLNLISKQVNMTPRNLVGMLADVHLYENQIECAKLQLNREPKKLPLLEVITSSYKEDEDKWTIWDWNYTDFIMVDYQHYDAIKCEVAV